MNGLVVNTLRVHACFSSSVYYMCLCSKPFFIVNLFKEFYFIFLLFVRNGHMVTHRDKKPHECSYQDCDKSYCDMRSLRRHLENHHAANQGGSGGSRTSSPALMTTESTDTLSGANVVNDATSGRVIKPSRGRPPKDRSLKHEVHDTVLDHLRPGEYESGKSSGTSTPGSTHDAAYVRDKTKIVLSRERNSDSFSSTGSEEVAHISSDKGTESKKPTTITDESKQHTAIDMLKQAAERVQEHREKQSAVEHYPPQGAPQQYMMYPEGIPYPQWYQASVFAGQDPRFGVYTYQQMFPQQVYHGHQMIVNGPNIQRQQLAARLYAEADKHNEIAQQQQPQQGPNVSQQLPSVEKPPSSTTQGSFRHQVVQSTAGTPTDPTAIAIATAKEKGQHLYTREGYYGVHPSGTQWQQVSLTGHLS